MAIASEGVGAHATGTTSVTPTWPSGYTPVAGHVAVLKLYTVGSTTDPGGGSSDWTEASQRTPANGWYDSGGTLRTYIRVLAGGDSLSAFTLGGATFMEAWIDVYSGVDTTTPLDTAIVTDESGGDPWQGPSITTVTDGAMVESTGISCWTTLTPVNTANGFTITTFSADSPVRRSGGTGYVIKTTAGAQTAPTWQAEGDPLTGVTIALRPASDAPPGPAIVTDDFNRASLDAVARGYLAFGQWSSTATIVGNKIQFSQASFANPEVVLFVQASDPTKCFAEWDWDFGGETRGPIICADGTNYQSGYEVFCFGWETSLRLRKDMSDVASAPGPTSGTHRIRIERSGNDITVSVDGTPVIEYEDTSSPLTGTWCGLGSSLGTITGDNFAGGDLLPATFVDDFNRADGSIGSNYTATAGSGGLPNIVSNQVSLAEGGGENCVRTAETFSADQEHYLDCTPSGEFYVWVAVRSTTDAQQYYEILWSHENGGTYVLSKGVAGSDIPLDSVTGIGDSGTRRLGVKAVGNTITGYVDGVLVLGPVTDDDNPTGGGPGFGGYLVSGTVLLDNAEGGDIGAPVLDAPTGLSGTPGNGEVNLTWTPPSGEIWGHEVDWALASAPTSWLGPENTASASGAFTLDGLTNGTAYVFRVRAGNGDGWGAWSTTSSSVTPVGPPAQVTGLTATAGPRPRRIALSWTAPADGGSAITDYLIEVSTDGGGSWSTISDGTSTTTSYTHTGLVAGTTYHYRVSAINAIGTGSASSTANAAATGHPWTTDTTFEVGTSLGTSNAQPLPSNAAAGDLVYYLIGHDNPGATAISVSSGWTLLSAQVQGSNVIKGAWAFRVLDGTTGSNILSVSGATQDYAIIPGRIPAGEHGVINPATDIQIANFASTSNGNCNPPSLNAGSTRDWLWLAGAVVDLTTGNTISGVPANYTQVENRVSASSTSSVATAVAQRRFTGSTEDPGTFTNTSRPYIGWTVAIPPYVVTIQWKGWGVNARIV